ncbi:MAG: hypothetical protein QXT77_07055 [Candidatus Methanomethylicaceae archaeon]
MIECPEKRWINTSGLRKTKGGNYVPSLSPAAAYLVPCGKCGICRMKKQSEWKFRIYHEMRTQTMPGYFVTLTYNRKSLPWSEGLPSLRFKDVQDFLKRLRFHGHKAKYLCTGEYGPTTQRPHYHLCIWTDATPDDLTKHWKNGSIHVGALTLASALYALKYIMNPTPKKEWNDPRERPRAQYSKGLGLGYLTINMYNYHTDDDNGRKYKRFEGYADGDIVPLPRYYINKIFTTRERRWHRAQSAAKAARRRLEFCRDTGMSQVEAERYLEDLNRSLATDLIKSNKKNQTL